MGAKWQERFVGSHGSLRGTVPGLMKKLTQDDRAFGDVIYICLAVLGERVG